MGGLETEVDDNTTNIVLEMANFDMYSIRRTSMAHGLFTDAVTRFNKGQSPLQNMAVAAKAVSEVIKIAGGHVAGKLVDDNRMDQTILGRNSMHFPVKVPVEFINLRLGLELTSADIKKILENVEFRVDVDGEQVTVTAPFWRTDIELREDVVEEVGRLYGYDKLPLNLPKRDLTATRRDPLLDLKAKIRTKLSRAGANEVLTYSFVPADLLQKTGQDATKAFQVSNAISPELEHYRLSLMPSLLDKVHPNIKAGYDEFALFELGKAHDLDHIDQDGLPVEFEFTGFVITAADKLKKAGSTYYEARKYLEFLTSADLVFKPISADMMAYPVVQPYEPRRSAMVSLKGGSYLGIIGEFKPSVTRALKLPKYTAGFEVDTLALHKLLSNSSSYQPLSRFPEVKQDITLRVKSEMTAQELYDLMWSELTENSLENTETGLDLIDIFQKQDDDSKQITFRVTITGTDRTLTDKEVTAVLDKIAEGTKAKNKTERI
jgi:phenylalanyl-tRNA synthetase beta chain